LLTLPDRKPTEIIHPTHLAAVRTVLKNYDILDEWDFVARRVETS
jgi:hypothetical protein